MTKPIFSKGARVIRGEKLSSPSEKDLRIKDEILSLIERRKGSYKCALIQAALTRENDTHKIVLIKALLLNEKVTDEKTLDYGDFIFKTYVMNVEEFKEFIKAIVDEKELRIKGLPT